MTSDHTEHTDPSGPSEIGESRSPVVSRRTMLVAGWSAPVIIAVAPSVAFAASGVVSGNTTSRGGGGGSTKIGGQGNTAGGGGTGNSGSPGSPSGSPVVSGVTEQQHQGAQPARTNRGFTG